MQPGRLYCLNYPTAGTSLKRVVRTDCDVLASFPNYSHWKFKAGNNSFYLFYLSDSFFQDGNKLKFNDKIGLITKWGGGNSGLPDLTLSSYGTSYLFHKRLRVCETLGSYLFPSTLTLNHNNGRVSYALAN